MIELDCNYGKKELCKGCGEEEESTEHMLKCRDMMKRFEKGIVEGMSVETENRKLKRNERIHETSSRKRKVYEGSMEYFIEVRR